MIHTVLFDSFEITFQLTSFSLIFQPLSYRDTISRRVNLKRGQTGMGQAGQKAIEESDR